MTRILTFEVEQYIGSIIFKHLSNEFDIHVSDVDLLVEMVPALVQDPTEQAKDACRTWRFLFKTITASLSFSWICQRLYTIE